MGMSRHSPRRVNSSVTAHGTKALRRADAPPLSGRALTVARWKRWSSCASSKGRQRPVLDRTLAAAGFTGIVVSASMGSYPAFGSPFYLVLHGSPITRDRATDCMKAVALLNKSTFSGQDRASDPAFNLVAHLVAAELNYAAGVEHDHAVTSAINRAVVLLGKHCFNGSGYAGSLNDVDAFAMNRLATILDHFNNRSHSSAQGTQKHV
jgi:hypothetical protein